MFHALYVVYSGVKLFYGYLLFPVDGKLPNWPSIMSIVLYVIFILLNRIAIITRLSRRK